MGGLGGLAGVLVCFGMILCWSRWRTWWFTTSVDRQHTFEGVARFFDAAGGVPDRPDGSDGRVGPVAGSTVRAQSRTLEFARHHGIEIKACQAGDAKRKGKVERPFRDLKESFLEELVVTGSADSIDELNRRAQLWVDQRVHAAESRSTGVAPAERFAIEREFLAALPQGVSTPTTSRPDACTGRCRSYLERREPLLGPTAALGTRSRSDAGRRQRRRDPAAPAR